MSNSDMSSSSSSLSSSGESLFELLSTLDADSTTESIWRLQLEAVEEIAQNQLPIPFLFPNDEDRSSAAASSRLAAAILTIENKNDRVRAVKYLLNAHSPNTLNRRDTRGRTPLMQAVARDDTSVIKLLVTCPQIDLTARDRFGNTILMYASGHGQRQTIGLVLDAAKSRFNEETWPDDMLAFLYAENYDDDTAFTLAFARGHDDCIRVLSDYFKEAIFEDERRKCSLIYRLGVRGAAVARALTNLQTKSAVFKRRPFMWKKWIKQNRSTDTHQNGSDQVISTRRRSLSQEDVFKKRFAL